MTAATHCLERLNPLPLPALDGLTELSLLASLDAPARLIAPSFCALLRRATQADWAALTWSAGDTPPLRYCCLGGWSRRAQLLRTLDGAAAGGQRGDAQVVSAHAPRGAGALLRIDCVGHWRDGARRLGVEALVAAAVGLLAACPVEGPPDAGCADGPSLQRSEGLLLTGADGTPQQWTDEAGRALATILDALIGQGATLEAAQATVRQRLQALMHRAPLLRRAGDAPVPAERFETPFGTIRLHGLRLLGGGAATAQLLHGTRELPWAVALVEGLAALPLSPRQKQVAFLAARGESYAGISRRLALSRPTVVDYMRGAYDKLGVASHEELAAYLVGRAALAPG